MAEEILCRLDGGLWTGFAPRWGVDNFPAPRKKRITENTEEGREHGGRETEGQTSGAEGIFIVPPRIATANLPAEFLAGLHLGHEALLGFEAAAGAHGLEHFAHLGVLAEQVVDVLDGGAGAAGDALAAAAVGDLVVAAFLGGHGVDDGLDAVELAFVDVLYGLLHAGEGADGREHLEDGLHGAHLFDLTELLAEVVEREAVAGEGFFGELLGLAAVEFGLGVLEQGGDVAHAHDAGDDAVGVERLEGVGLFAGAEELDGRAGDVADGEGGAAAGVAVHLGEDDAGEGEQRVEGLGRVDGVLASHGVGDEEDFAGVEELFEGGHLVHEVGGDLVAAGGVDDEDVAAEAGGFAAGVAGEAQYVFGSVLRIGVELALVDLRAGGAGDDRTEE